MNSIRALLLCLISILFAACDSAPREAGQTAATPASAPSPATGSSIAVGHDSAPAAGGQSAPAGGAPVKWTAPARWTAKPAGGMRLATYLIPAAKDDSEGGECAVFGNTIGGGVQANIDRWIGQFEKTDGEPKQKKETITGLEVTTVDVSGTFKGGGPMMGQSSGPKAGFRLLGAIVETPEGEVFFKLTGPAKTITAAQSEFQSLLKSLRK
ncbi:MAG: hypothetical protein ACREEM_24740 [Blastocatellia bacterium]